MLALITKSACIRLADLQNRSPASPHFSLKEILDVPYVAKEAFYRWFNTAVQSYESNKTQWNTVVRTKL